MGQPQTVYNMDQETKLILIAGGSASGKSTITRNIIDGDERMLHISLDDFFGPFDHLTYEERVEINWDHPDALDWEEVTRVIDDLLHGWPTKKPVYDFETAARSYEYVSPADVIIMEGTHAMWNDDLREIADLCIFMDTDLGMRLHRRVVRDIDERGMRAEDVVSDFTRNVMPMHDEYIEPRRDEADIVIPNRGTDTSVDVIRGYIETLL